MLEHRDAFMQSLRAGPEARRRIFESLERRFGQDFADGRSGQRLYETLHSAVQDAAVPGAVAEFEGRFLPLVNGHRTPVEVDPAEATASEETGGRKPRGSWISAISAVVLVGGLLALGLGVLNAVLTAKPPGKNKPSVSRVQAREAPRPRPANPVRTLEDNQTSSAPGQQKPAAPTQN
jgi:hypothetical protein